MSASRRSGVLEFAILGLLRDSPMHGYELRKRLNGVMGSFRAISYGSLYPALRDMVDRGLIAEAGAADASAPVLSRGRAKIVYELTADGKDRFDELVSRTGPDAWEDDAFGVRVAFFASTPAEVRMRILEGRRTRMEERLDNLHSTMTRNRERIDSYTQALQRHGLEGVEREVRWLTELIENENNERRGGSPDVSHNPTGDAGTGPRRPRTRG